jgi:hypothetical protein
VYPAREDRTMMHTRKQSIVITCAKSRLTALTETPPRRASSWSRPHAR